MSPLKIAYVVMRYPTLSQTFIEREMRALVKQGFAIEVHPCLDFRPPATLPPTPPELVVVRAGSLPRVLGAALVGMVRELSRRPTLIPRGLGLFVRHFPRHWEGAFHTFWGTVFAFARAAEFRRRGATIIHGAWATAPATAAAVLGELCGQPFSFGAHAYDLHRHGGDPLLAPKLRHARFVHTTTEANVLSLRARFPDHRAEIVLSRRGLPQLPEQTTPRARADGGSRDEEIRLLSVGRLVPKKGHAHQIDACAELVRRGQRCRLRIVGGGPLEDPLRTHAARAGLADRIELAGELPPGEVAAAYAWADVFWHTGIVDAQGDRDGLPNVVPEAMAHGLPVISSAAGGAGEAVIDGETGLIVDPTDPQALADAVVRLAADPALGHRLGAAGRRWVEENFLSETNARILARAFRL